MTRTRRHWHQPLRFAAIVGLVMLVGLVVASGTFAWGTDQWTIEKSVSTSYGTFASTTTLALKDGESGLVWWKVTATKSGGGASCDEGDKKDGGDESCDEGNKKDGGDESCDGGNKKDGGDESCDEDNNNNNGSSAHVVDTTQLDESISDSKTWIYSQSWSCENGTAHAKDEATSPYTNTATITWGEKDDREASDSATATVTCAEKPTTPPDVPPTVVPPPVVPQQPVTPPTPKVDVQVTKTGVASGLYITWTVVVKNEGTGQADAVKVSDTLPAGPTITSGPSLSQGGWNSASKVWDVGQILAGNSATMTVVMFAAEGGTFTNAVIVTAPNETGTKDNNTAVATVTVSAPFTPPTVNPKPKPKPVVKPNVCAIVAIGKKSVSVGKASNIKVVTSRGGNPLVGAVVQFKGAGVYKFGTTGKGGVAVVSINASKPGIVTVSVAGKKTCSAQRLGVIGSFEPAVTG